MRFLQIICIICSFQAVAEDKSRPYIEFLQATAVATALAETQHPDPVKFMVFSEIQPGQAGIKGLWIGEDHGSALETPEDITAIAHFHNSQMKAQPEPADFTDPICAMIHCFVVSNDGSKIWQISIKDGVNQFRDVSSVNHGNWIKHNN